MGMGILLGFSQRYLRDGYTGTGFLEAIAQTLEIKEGRDKEILPRRRGSLKLTFKGSRTCRGPTPDNCRI